MAGRRGIYAAPRLHDGEMQRRASLVIASADTTIIQQSLAAGTPVLVVPEAEEPLAYAHAVAAKGAAELIHTSEPAPEAIRLMVVRMLADPGYTTAAKAIATRMAQYDSGKAIVDFVDDVLEVATGEIAA